MVTSLTKCAEDTKYEINIKKKLMREKKHCINPIWTTSSSYFYKKNVDATSMIFQNLNPQINKEGASHYALFVTPVMLQYI